MKKSQIKLTKAGCLYIAVTLGLGLAAINTGNNLLYLLTSTFLSFMFLAGVFGKKNIEALDVILEFPEEIYCGKETFIKVKIFNKKRFFPGFLIKIDLKDFNVSVLFPYFEKEETAIVQIKPKKRGLNYIKDIYLSSVFPFNFFVRFKKINKIFSFIAFPKPKKCKYFIYQDEKNKEGQKELEKYGFEGEILFIKDYTEGTPIKYIHWKASAKTQDLKVKQLSQSANQPIIIHFEKIPIPDIEEKLSCITFLILEYIKKNIPIGLKIKNKFYKPEISFKQKIKLLTELALYE